MFSKPHTRGREEDRLGRDLALCESKQKSLGTMNNKSIQKKKESLFEGGETSAGGEQLLAKSRACTSALWLPGNTRGSASQDLYVVRGTMTTKPNEFPRQECGCSVTVEPVMGSDLFWSGISLRSL